MNQQTIHSTVQRELPQLIAQQQIEIHDDSDEDGIQTVRKTKYGNMVVLYDGCVLITLGPNYCFFSTTFLIFTIASYFIVALVNQYSQNEILKIVTFIVCLGECLSYFLVAFSNPGIVTKSVNSLPERYSRKCFECNITVPINTRHCKDCGVCISNYDHHCPWTSKCIGSGNIIQFYVFLILTPFFLVYLMVMFVYIMGEEFAKTHKITVKI